jgi:DDE domain
MHLIIVEINIHGQQKAQRCSKTIQMEACGWWSYSMVGHMVLSLRLILSGFKRNRGWTWPSIRSFYNLCWAQEYAPEINKRTKPYLKTTCDSWKVDETYLKIKGIWHYLYRAIDKRGNTLDWMLSVNRNKQSAKRFFKKLLGNTHTVNPRVINVDKSPTFPPALNELQAEREVPKKNKITRN